MKITPIKYAKALTQLLSSDSGHQQTVRNFLIYLRRKKQLKLLPKIVKAFENEWAAAKGIVRLKVEYPEKFPESAGEFEKSLGQKLGKIIECTTTPSKTIIGGLRVIAEDTLIDASIEGRLLALNKRLAGE